MTRPSRKTEIKEKVLTAALELIAEGGFTQSPMSKLAQLAEVSVGSIYLYFPSKDDLIVALFEDVRQKMQENILQNYDIAAPVQKRFETIFLNTCNYYLEHKEHFVFMDQFALSTYNKNALDAFSEEAARAFLSLYQDGVKTGALKNLHLEIILSLTHGPIVSLIKKHHMGFMKVNAKTLHELKDCVWQAIGA